MTTLPKYLTRSSVTLSDGFVVSCSLPFESWHKGDGERGGHEIC
jgi:hypothetical protein